MKYPIKMPEEIKSCGMFATVPRLLAGEISATRTYTVDRKMPSPTPLMSRPTMKLGSWNEVVSRVAPMPNMREPSPIIRVRP